MTTPETPPRAEATPATPSATPQLRRPTDGRILAGVCAGIADHLGWPVWPVRIGFIVLGVQFVGLLVYAALWLLVPQGTGASTAAPGLRVADRAGMRPERPVDPERSEVDRVTVVAVVVLGAGLVVLAAAFGMFGDRLGLLWPLLFAAGGVTLIWRQADNSTTRETVRATAGSTWLAPLMMRGQFASTMRLVIGLTLLLTAFAMTVSSQFSMDVLPQVVGISVLAVIGVGILVAPWALRFRATLHEARDARVRADERADMAAHLHDSVLQTLALIQRQSEDARAVQALARRQERELRTWLYGDVPEESTLKAALTVAATEIEDERGLEVELVVVGDCDLDDAGAALVRAAREALMNAAKHSGCETVDVYAEVTEDLIEVFIRDRGVGFDMSAIGEDRMGVRRSIIDRMERHGGSARIRSAPGEGTEVRLELER